MKTIKISIIGLFSLISAVSFAQNPSSQSIPLQDSSRMDQGKKLNSSPTPMPKSGTPSDDTLIRNQSSSSTSMDSTKMNNKKMKGMKKGRRKGGSGEMDITSTRRNN